VITYAGQTLIGGDSPDAELTAFLERYLPLGDTALIDWLPRDYWTYFTGSDDDRAWNAGLPRMNWPTRSRARINSLYWPIGATRWSTFIAITTGQTLQQILAVVENPPQDQQSGQPQNNQNNAAQLCLSDTNWNIANDQTVGQGGQPNPNAFTTDGNGLVAISTAMYLLQPRQLTQPGPGTDTLWLLPLVDERYFWRWRPADLGPLFAVNPPTVQGMTFGWWSQALQLLAAQTDNGTLNVSSVNASYPGLDAVYGQYASHWKRPGVLSQMLDAAALSCGLRIVRGVTGNVSAISPTDSTTKYQTNTTPPNQTMAGQLICGGDVSSMHRNGAQPNSVELVFNPSATQNQLAAITGADADSWEFTVSGDIHNALPEGATIHVINSTANNGRYHVSADATYNAQTNATAISVQEEVASGSAGGMIVYGVQSTFVAASDTAISSASGGVGTQARKRIVTTAQPVSQSNALTFAQAVAQDFYSWKQTVFDFCYAAICPWDSTGFDDSVEWRMDFDAKCRQYAFFTRAQSLPPNCEITQLAIDATPQVAWLVADFPNLTAQIVGVTAGAAGSGSFQVAGNQTGTFSAGFPFRVVDSAGNDGDYRTSPAGSSFGDNLTTIPVNEAVSSVVGNGSIAWSIQPLPVVGASSTANTLTVVGNYANLFALNWELDCVRSANNSNTYQITALNYNAGANQTTFTLSPDVPSSTADGYILPHYPAPHEAPQMFPASDAGGVNFGSPTGSAPTEFWGTSSPEPLVGCGKYIPRGSLVRAQWSEGAWVPVAVLPATAFIYAGGGNSTGGTPRQHSRLDPATGATLWTVDRGNALLAMAIDPQGYVYTGGGGSPAEQTAAITDTIPGQPGIFQFEGYWVATFVSGFPFIVTGATNNGEPFGNGNFTTQYSYSNGAGQTVVYTNEFVIGGNGGFVNFTSADAGTTLEKWSSAGEKLWSASAGEVKGIALDSSGNVYALNTNAQVLKYDPNGNQINTGGFPLSMPTAFAGAQVNCIAVDPIDGRIAVGVGTLEIGFPVPGGIGTQFFLALFSAQGIQITLPSLPNNESESGPLASCRFGRDGTLYAVGIANSSFKGSIGLMLDYQANFVNWITWSPPGNYVDFGYSVAADDMGRFLVGGEAMPLFYESASVYTTAAQSPYTISVMKRTPAGSGTNAWLFKIASEQNCLSVAADRAGRIYGMCASPGINNTTAQAYCFDPLGALLWMNGLLQIGFIWPSFYGNPNEGPPAPLFIAAH
jgi:hypothetical protein